MALVFHSGFETGGFDEWASVTGSPTVQGTTKKTGGYAMRCNATGTAMYATSGMGQRRRLSCYIYVASAPSSDTIIIGDSGFYSAIRLTSAMKLDLYDVGTGSLDLGNTVLETGRWYRISYSRTDVTTVKVYLDGVEECSATAVNIGDNCGVLEDVTADIYFDDFAVGSNIYGGDIGDIRVLPARPTAEGTDQDTGTGADWQDSDNTPAVYTEIDQDPPNITDYNWAEADGVTMRYTVDLDDCGAGNLAGIGGSDTIEAVNFMWYYETDGGGVGDYGQVIYDETVRQTDDTIDDPKDPTWLEDYYALTPKDSDAWTQTHVNDLEMGMACHDASKDMWFYEAYAMVAFKVVAAAESPSVSPSSSESPSVSPSSSESPSVSPSSSESPSVSPSSSESPSLSPSSSESPSVSPSASLSPSSSESPSVSPSSSESPSVSPSSSESPSVSPSASVSPSSSESPSVSPSSSESPSTSPSSSESPSVSPSSSESPSLSPSSSVSPSSSESPSVSPSSSESPSVSPSSSESPSVSPSSSESPSVSPSASVSPSSSESPSVSPSSSESPSVSPSSSESPSVSPSSSESPSVSPSASLSPSSSESPSVSPSSSESPSTSPSSSESPSESPQSPSISPSSSVSPSSSESPSVSPSSSESPSVSPSLSTSPSSSESPSLSPSSSESPSVSPSSSESPSVSPSSSESPSVSPSASVSPSSSESPSISPSSSESPSLSPSSSESPSVSPSSSESPSVSPSASVSPSSSESPSVSPSSSASPSEVPLPDDADYTSGDIASLTVDDTDLEYIFTGQDYLDVETEDAARVEQEAYDPEFAVFLFKDKNTSQQDFTVEWIGQAIVAPSSIPVYLEVYNRTGANWEQLDVNNAANADEDFTLTGSVSADLGEYFDGSYWISCRVYQSAA